jgi:hypothetical protein
VACVALSGCSFHDLQGALQEHSRFEAQRKQDWLCHWFTQNKNGCRLSAARVYSQYFLELL